MKLVTNKESMPTEEHYVILVFTSQRVSGDNHVPGTMYYATKNRQEWEKEISERAIDNGNEFVAFKAGPLATIKLRAEVTIK